MDPRHVAVYRTIGYRGSLPGESLAGSRGLSRRPPRGGLAVARAVRKCLTTPAPVLALGPSDEVRLRFVDWMGDLRCETRLTRNVTGGLKLAGVNEHPFP